MKFNQNRLILFMKTLLLLVCVQPVFSSDPVEDIWLAARKGVDADIPRMAPIKGEAQNLRNMVNLNPHRAPILAREMAHQRALHAGLLIERQRLKQDAPILRNPVPLHELVGDEDGVSPFGYIVSAEKTGRVGTWCYRFPALDPEVEAFILVAGLPGNQIGTRVLAGPFGDVEEVPVKDVKKRFGFVPNCMPLKMQIFLLTQRPYADQGTGTLPTLEELKSKLKN